MQTLVHNFNGFPELGVFFVMHNTSHAFRAALDIEVMLYRPRAHGIFPPFYHKIIYIGSELTFP